jgi:hypothetical protein
MRMYPYSAERRDVLGNTPLEDREIFQELGFGTLQAPGSVLGNTVPQVPRDFPRVRISHLGGQGSVLVNTAPWEVFSNTYTLWEAGSVLGNMISVDHMI